MNASNSLSSRHFMRRSAYAIAIVTIIALAFAIRFATLGARGLWLDEAFTAIAADGGPRRLVALLRHDSGPALFYLITGFSRAIGGTAELWLRVPAALAGALSVVAIVLLARRATCRTASLFVGLFAALSPLLVHHAQEARYNAFLPLLSALVLFLLDRALAGTGRRTGAFAGYALALGFALHLHTYALLLFPAAYAFAWLRRGAAPLAPQTGPLTTAHAAALLVYLPWVPILLAQIQAGGVSWAEPHFGATAPVRSLAGYLPTGPWPVYLGLEAPAGAAAMSLGFGGALLAAAGIGLARKPSARRPSAAFAAYGLVPLGIVYAISLIGPVVHVVGRGDLLFLPPLLVAAAIALEALSARMAPAIAALAGAALALPALTAQLSADDTSSDRDLARALATRLEPGDVVAPVGLAYATIYVYLGKLAPATPVVPFPLSMRTHPGNLDGPAVWSERARLFDAFADTLGSVRGPSGRVIAVLPPGPLGRLVARELSERLEPARAPDLDGRLAVLGIPLAVRAFGPGAAR